MAAQVTDGDSSQLLHSQKLLDQSIECISNGMELENNNDLETALLIYEKGISLLTEANEIETNNDVLPIISANLESIQQRIDSVRDKLQFDSMITNLQQMQQQSIDILNDYNNLYQQHESLNNQYDELINNTANYEEYNDNEDEDDNNIINIDNTSIDNADQMLTNLYQQYFGTNYNDIDIEDDEEDDDDDDNDDNNNNDENITESKEEKESEHIMSETIDWNNYNLTESLINNIPNDICGYIFEFISGRQLTKLFLVSKYWCYCLLYDPIFLHLWKRIIIGADPIRNSLGHNLKLKWIKTKIFGSLIRLYMETLIISTAGLALDALLKATPDEDLYILRQFKFPKLRTLIFYGWSSMSVMSLKMVLKHNLTDLTALYLETPIDVLDICQFLPNLRVLSCNVIHCNNLQLTEKHQFKNIEYLSFIYGVDDFILNRIFYSFPNLIHIGLEFDEIASSLNKLLMYKTNKLNVFHISWNPKSFWGINKNRGQSDVEYWLKDSKNITNLILDRDYVFDDDDKTVNVEAISVLNQLLPNINVTIAGGECTYNLTSFAKYCGLS